MRPDMKAPDPNSSAVKSVAQAVTKPSSSPASRPTARPSPVPLRQFASPKGRGKLNRGLPPSGTSARPSPEELASRRPPVTSSQQKQARTDSLRMKRTKITKKSPVIRDISKPVEAQTEIPKPPKTEMPPVEHSPQHRPTNSMDLDDLFGFGGQDEGRVKMPKRTKKKR
jgi:hypothetical protein